MALLPGCGDGPGAAVARRISKGTRAELLAVVGERYRGSGRGERSRILDEFVAVTGYHRKHAIRLLTRDSQASAQPEERSGPRCRYGDAVRHVLVALWEASDRVCSKRLQPLISVLLPALERHGEVASDTKSP